MCVGAYYFLCPDYRTEALNKGLDSRLPAVMVEFFSFLDKTMMKAQVIGCYEHFIFPPVKSWVKF